MSKNIKIGIIGCGGIAEKHLNAYKNIKNSKVIAVSDSNKGLAKQKAKKYKAKAYTDYKELLKIKDIDAIDVCVPTPIHHKIVLEALDNGKDVFCEKPLTHKLEYAEEIYKKQKKTGKIVRVGYLYRFHPAFQRLKEILEASVIGNPYFAFFRLGGRGGQRIWKHKKNGGGALLEMMVHMLDLALMCFKEFSQVRTLFCDTILKLRMVEGIEITADAEDCILVWLKSKDGVEVFCESDLITPSYMNGVEIHGNNGSFFGTILHYFPTFVYCKNPRGIYKQGLNIFTNPYVNLFEEELKQFINALCRDVDLINSIEDSIKILKLIEEIRWQLKRRN